MDSEEAVLFFQSFFAQIECFDWSSALGVIRRQRDSWFQPVNALLSALLNCERSYYAMSYTDHQIIQQYNSLKEQIESFSTKTECKDLYRDLLCHFVTIVDAKILNLKICLLFRENEYRAPRSVSFRQTPTMFSLLDQKKADDVISELHDLEEKLLEQDYKITHWVIPPLFTQLKKNLGHEIFILRMVLSAGSNIRELKLKESCFSLFRAKQKLASWENCFFSSILINSQALYGWLARYIQFLLSKLSLYFHKSFTTYHTARRETTDLSSIFSQKQMKPNFMKMIHSFCTKTSTDHLSIILNYNGFIQDYGQCSFDGYTIPIPPPEEQSGLRSWPEVFHFPANTTRGEWLAHLPGVVGTLTHHAEELACGQPLIIPDKKLKIIYHVQGIEKHIYLVIVSQEKKYKTKNASLFASHLAASLAMISPVLRE